MLKLNRNRPPLWQRVMTAVLQTAVDVVMNVIILGGAIVIVITGIKYLI